MPTSVTAMEVRLVELEEISGVEFGGTAKGYAMSAARVRGSIKKRYENLRLYANGYRSFTPYEWTCLNVDAQALAEDGNPDEKSMYAGLAFALLTQPRH